MNTTTITNPSARRIGGFAACVLTASIALTACGRTGDSITTGAAAAPSAAPSAAFVSPEQAERSALAKPAPVAVQVSPEQAERSALQADQTPVAIGVSPEQAERSALQADDNEG